METYNEESSIGLLMKHPNGGGLVSKTATVDESVYVADSAIVYSGIIKGKTNIESDARIYGKVEISGTTSIKWGTFINGNDESGFKIENCLVHGNFYGQGNFKNQVLICKDYNVTSL